MTAEFLSLLCLGLCLGYEDEKKNEKPPKPSLHAWPSSVVEAESNVTLKCQAHSQNVTFVLRKVNDSGYKQEQSSAENEAEFPFTDLKPKDAGRYFCAYKTTASHEWSESSEHLQLVVTDKHDELEAPSMKTDGETEAWRRLRKFPKAIGSSSSETPEPSLSPSSAASPSFSSSSQSSSSTDAASTVSSENAKGERGSEGFSRTSHSKLPEQEAAEADLSNMERVSLSTADPQGVTYAELSTSALSEAASDTTQEPPGSHEYAALKV
ncbi:V-set and transmembrane domain-containing protein 1 isoform X6 [Homo sapiens]|uniref:V-set and transmembrane domain-containing protein 1 isoform X6 n=1 Tax=Homo sapiens TaxID=9606 RepID=UPI0005D02EBA|nr:V-set and transmembrane domain-containing protein 1 isoform X6 [Homo sapiens]XP_054176656.1 V-set and transmembrane domain-containing protein 1 isoform X6 [Homo sapiens]XP_054185654.1 V-set and transmembrane domain-containing protein 1 isoform X6 [Homo sapiens]XP_054186138.1 V-set and transmembrane domain-containing protein 1 isoform X6 [Homo sapiens]XP_054186446.1 V-set and transmembrane domain-containing protein 1 isoform X6 [Homo sapiens]XP_054186699.1 V-set and transmembrane domain-cont|eukprot:XP_011525151.1 V-set and transmembrane domain-containing protein 1 isoform X5 [Homo sapiens]